MSEQSRTVDDVLLKYSVEDFYEIPQAKQDLLRIILEALPKERQWDEMTVETRNDFNWGYESALAEVRKKVEDLLR